MLLPEFFPMVLLLQNLSECLSFNNNTYHRNLFLTESEIPGFLKIESVSTLDPAAASQMFGDG